MALFLAFIPCPENQSKRRENSRCAHSKICSSLSQKRTLLGYLQLIREQCRREGCTLSFVWGFFGLPTSCPQTHTYRHFHFTHTNRSFGLSQDKKENTPVLPGDLGLCRRCSSLRKPYLEPNGQQGNTFPQRPSPLKKYGDNFLFLQMTWKIGSIPGEGNLL